jgi:hypothetical protein
MMIQTGSGSGLVEMLSRWDVFELRYVLASYYHGLTFLTYGRNDPGILVTQATLHLSASLIMLLIGQQILRKRGNLTVLVLVFLYWPDFLQYMLTANRDLLVLLGVCLWLLGRRSLIHLQAAEGLAAGLAVLVLVLTRPILLLVVGVDALLILLLHARRGSAGMATGIAKLKLLPVAGFLGLAVVGILTDTGLGTSDLRTEEYVSQIASGYTKGAGRISGTLGGLTGIGLLISLPIRILISVYSPWPWTTGFQFESLTGFNNSVALLTLHVVKAIAACTGVLLFVVGTLRVWKLSAIRRWECQQWWYLVLAFLLSVAFAMPGYNRYIMMSYPALLVALLKLSESVPRAYMQRTVVGTTFGVMLGTMLMVLVY